MKKQSSRDRATGGSPLRLGVLVVLAAFAAAASLAQNTAINFDGTHSLPAAGSPPLGNQHRNIQQGQASTADRPDSVGDVGENYYIQMINGQVSTLSGGWMFDARRSQIQIYRKSDMEPLLPDPTYLGAALGSHECADDNIHRFDPIVVYDRLDDRWLLTEVTGNFVSGRPADNYFLCVYVSKASDPWQGFYAYRVETPDFPDYPKYGVGLEGYYVTAIERPLAPFGAHHPPSIPAVYALQRSKMLGGQSASMQRFTAPRLAGFDNQGLTPADLDGPDRPAAGTAAWFARHRDDELHNSPGTSGDFIEIWGLKVNWDVPHLSVFQGPTNVKVAEFDSDLCSQTPDSCFQQPETDVRLDPQGPAIMWRLQYRVWGTVQALLGTFVTDVGNDRGGIFWFQLYKSTDTTPWMVWDQGTYSPAPNVNRWMGSAAADTMGNFAVIYNRSSHSVFPSIGVAARCVDDLKGQLPKGEYVIGPGVASSTTTSHWGDYSSLNVDPVDDRTFWGTAQYNPGAAWGTMIVKFNLQQIFGCS